MPLLFLLVACTPTLDPRAAAWSDRLDPARVDVACAVPHDLPPRRACPECGFRFSAAPAVPAGEYSLDGCLAAGVEPTRSGPAFTTWPYGRATTPGFAPGE